MRFVLNQTSGMNIAELLARSLPWGPHNMSTNKTGRHRRIGYLAIALTTLLAPAGKIITASVAAAALGTLVSSADKPLPKKPVPLTGTLHPVLQATEAHHNTTHIESGHGVMRVVLNDVVLPGSDTDGDLGDYGSGITPLAALDHGAASGPRGRALSFGNSGGGSGGPGSGGPGAGGLGSGGPGGSGPEYGEPVKGPVGDELPGEDEVIRIAGLDDAAGLSARAAEIPEPSSWALLLIGLLGLTGTLRKKTK